jgi:DHA1 family bicyclomycin/chloramphenicol resistance-like MFS transporter
MKSPGRAGLVANLIAQLAFGLMVMTICLPSMPSWVDGFGASTAVVQLTFSAYVVAFGVFQLLYGPLSDRLGRRPILMAGLVVAVIGSLAAMVATDLPTLIAARVLQGAGTAAGMVIGRALVQDLFDGADRTRVMAIVGMAMGLSPPAATLLGGQLHVQWGWTSNFALVAGLGVLLFVAAWRGLPDEGRPAKAPGHWARAMAKAYARLGREPDFRRFVTILAMSTATFYAFLAGAPLVLGRLGVGPAHMGLYIMAIPLAYIGGNALATRLAHAAGDRALMRWGQATTLTGLLLMLGLVLAGRHGALAFAAPLALVGLGHGLLMPPTLSGTVGVIPALAGSAAAVGGLLQQLMGAAGGYVVGLVPHDTALGVGALMLLFTVCALLAQVGLQRRSADLR